jgi:hypothetical protein
MKNTLWGIRDLIILHISYVEEMLEELEETENISTQQKERATTLLWPSQNLINLEQLLKKVQENSENPSNNSAPNI